MNVSQPVQMPVISSWRRWLLLSGIAFGVFLIDQISKLLVTTHLALGESWAPIPAVADFFEITRSSNTGAAFSLLSGANSLLLILSLVMIVVILAWYRQVASGHRLQSIALGILLGGVMGNAFDRVRLGTVVDFIHWQLPHVISNVSNPADHAIVLSVALLLLDNQRSARSEVSQNTS